MDDKLRAPAACCCQVHLILTDEASGSEEKQEEAMELIRLAEVHHCRLHEAAAEMLVLLRGLLKVEPTDDDGMCVFCREYVEDDCEESLERHKADCPDRRARELVARLDGLKKVFDEPVELA